MTDTSFQEIGGCGNVKDDPTSPKTCSILRRSLFFLSVVKNSVIVALGMLLAYILERNNLNYLKLTGCVTGGFPHFAIPTIDNFIEMVEEFGVSMIFIPMVAILETIAIAKVFCECPYEGQSHHKRHSFQLRANLWTGAKKW